MKILLIISTQKEKTKIKILKNVKFFDKIYKEIKII